MTDLYGAHETNPLSEAAREFQMSAEETVDWTDPRLARITRLRLLSDPGLPWWDVSYAFGQLKTGEAVEVRLPFDQLPKRQTKAAILDHARKAGVYAKGLGILDNLSTLC